MDVDVEASFAKAPVAVLATVGADGAPHVVPVVFAVGVSRDATTVYTAVDAKRKSTHRLRRLANIAANPRVSLLVDHYDADWTQLSWIRVDGVAAVHERGEEMAIGYAALRRKYPQYERVALDGPVVTVAVTRWSSWTPERGTTWHIASLRGARARSAGRCWRPSSTPGPDSN